MKCSASIFLYIQYSVKLTPPRFATKFLKITAASILTPSLLPSSATSFVSVARNFFYRQKHLLDIEMDAYRVLISESLNFSLSLLSDCLLCIKQWLDLSVYEGMIIQKENAH
jgi:hypothetical protein